MAAISSPEDAVNEALRAIGFPHAVGDIYEGSPQSRVALELYSQTRDEVLTSTADDAFNRGEVLLTLLKGPPPLGGFSPITPWSTVYPSPGFLYEYAYPPDAVEIRALLGQPGPYPNLDPQPAAWRIDNDLLPNVSGIPPAASGPPQKVVLTNLAQPLAVYRRRVTNLLLWNPAGLAALVARLAAKFASSPQLAAAQQMTQTAPQEAVFTANVARGHRG